MFIKEKKETSLKLYDPLFMSASHIKNRVRRPNVRLGHCQQNSDNQWD